MDEDHRPRTRVAAAAALLVSFSSFFVFPALPIGRTVALTIPVVLAAIVVLASLPRLGVREWSPYVLIIAPAVVSGWYVVLAGTALGPEIVPRAVIAGTLSPLAIVPILHLLRAGYRDRIVLGAALAILVHAALGAHQVSAFERLEFPFIDLMNTNPGLALLAQDPDTYARWTKRPFGLFAEPSAMAACIGPWLVVIAHAVFSRSGGGSRSRTLVLALALAGGTWLVVASKSGMAATIVVGTAVTALGAAFSWRRSVGKRMAALVMGGVIALSAVTWLTENASTRFDLAENESWQARLDSLVLGIRSLAASIDAGEGFLGGVGPGQEFLAVQSTQQKYEASPGVTAVWSIGLNYAIENGLLGVAAMLVLAACAAWSIWASGDRLAGAACAFVWVTGMLLATSYAAQPALWTGLGALLAWRYIAPPEPELQPAAPEELQRAELA